MLPQPSIARVTLNQKAVTKSYNSIGSIKGRRLKYPKHPSIRSTPFTNTLTATSDVNRSNTGNTQARKPIFLA
jgi:hypothetical protein